MAKDLQVNAQKKAGKWVGNGERQLAEERTLSTQHRQQQKHRKNARNTTPREKKNCILWILTDDAGCACVGGVLPLQSTKDHVHRSRTIEIGRQKQRAVYAYSTYYWICERKCVHQRTSTVSTQAINRHGNDSNNNDEDKDNSHTATITTIFWSSNCCVDGIYDVDSPESNASCDENY